MVRAKIRHRAGFASLNTNPQGEPNMPSVIKEIICRDRIRRIRGGFGWVDHRLVRDRYVERCSPTALAVYLFLIAVADADGVSYWGDAALGERLRLGKAEVEHARHELEAADLIAYEKPLWQILQLPIPQEVQR
jgi:hypothetical protein